MITANDILCLDRKETNKLPKNHLKLLNTSIFNFTKGCNGVAVSLEEARAYPDNTWVIYGAGMIKAVKNCWENNTPFFYIDNQYLGNMRSKKQWHRIIKDHVHDIRPIIERPRDRLEQVIKYIQWAQLKRPELNPTLLDPKPFTSGRNILIAPPSPKSFTLWNIDQQQWIDQTVAEIKKYTDRPIKIRLKRPRDDRFIQNTLEDDLKDSHCLVTYNSVAACEAIINGTPAFTLGPNAAQQLAKHDLSEIENPYIPSDDEREAWLRHLSYSQFTRTEMNNGTAWGILNG